MKKQILSIVLSSMMATALLAGCGKKAPSTPTDIVNGSFEDAHDAGKWVGWTKSDAAFNVRGLVDAEKVNGAVIEKDGSFFFSGTNAGNQAMRGTLTSDVFKLGGNGFITFKMGAGKNTEKVYVDFYEEKNDTPIAHITNPECDGVYITDHLITKVVDLSAYIGKNIYIKVTDNDDGNDFAYINLDGFKVCENATEVDAAKAAYALQIETYGEKPFEEDPTSTAIVNGSFETGDLTGWKILEGTAFSMAGIVPTSQMYWTDRMVYGHGEYYLDGNNNGAILESLTGAIRSTKFTLAGDGFITFMMGAGNGNSYVAVCDAETDEELIVKRNESFSDPALALTLLRVYVDAGQYIGKTLYIKVVDANDGGGFAFLNVDDFRVSLTKDEVAALEVEQLECIQNETYTSASYDDLTALLNYYNSYSYPVALQSVVFTDYAKNQVLPCQTADLTKYLEGVKATYGSKEITDFTITEVTYNSQAMTGDYKAFDLNKAGYYRVTYEAAASGKTATATFTLVVTDNNNQIANGGFESGDLTGWTVETDNWGLVDGKPVGVISAADYWGEKMPYNQAGNYHLDGWNTGIEEGATWSVRSTNFTLAGSGFISVRMGGHAAAVRVYKSNGEQVGYYTQNRFSDLNFPSLLAGGSWADMGTYVMDLSAYLGEELYIQLCDEQVDGWAQAFFDEVVTYYETAPDYENMADKVPDGATAEEVSIPWQLVTSK